MGSFWESPVDWPEEEFVVFSTVLEVLNRSGEIVSVSTKHVLLVSDALPPMVVVGSVYQSQKPSSSPWPLESFSDGLFWSLDPFYYILLF